MSTIIFPNDINGLVYVFEIVMEFTSVIIRSFCEFMQIKFCT